MLQPLQPLQPGSISPRRFGEAEQPRRHWAQPRGMGTAIDEGSYGVFLLQKASKSFTSVMFSCASKVKKIMKPKLTN